MDFFTVEHVLRMGLELTLGVCIKLFCDNGRIHWRDFVNDALFWLPGVQQLAGDGVSRQIAASVAAPVAAPVDDVTPLAAK